MSPQINKADKPSILAVGCFLPFLLVAIAAIIYTTNSFYKSQISKNWKPTEATILKTGMKTSQNTRSGHPSLRATALYTYKFDGTIYQNDQVTFDAGMDNYEQSSSIHRTLYHAKKILIYVNPNNPHEAIVIKGLTNSLLLTILFLFLYLCITYGLYQFIIKSMFPVGFIAFIIVAGLGLFVFGTNLIKVDMKNKITVLEVADEDKPPLELIIEDVRNGITNNSFKEYDELYEIFDIKVLSNESLFNNRMPPYHVLATFAYLENGVKKISRGSIIYVKKEGNWEVDPH